jgi:hypothetical protein
MPFRRGATPRQMASPTSERPAMATRGGRVRQRLGIAAGWTVVLLVLGVVAFIVGRPGQDAGVLGATPPASSTSPLPIAFGTAIDRSSGEASKRTTTFRRGQPFAYSVRLPRPAGTADVYVEVLRDSAGTLSQLQAPTLQKTLPDRAVIAYLVTVDGLVEAFGTGTLVLRIYIDPSVAPVAEGRFTIVP